MDKGHWTVLNSCREERFRGKRGHRGWNGWGKTNGSGAAPPHTSRFPAAQRLQECLGARLSRESCSYSCILFLQAAPDNTCLFIALGSFSAWLSKGRPCLQVTKVSCKRSKQKARPEQAFHWSQWTTSGAQKWPFYFWKRDLSTNKGLVLGVTTIATGNLQRINLTKFEYRIMYWSLLFFPYSCKEWGLEISSFKNAKVP